MNNNWITTSNGDNNFVDLFKARFASKTRVNQWYHKLTTLRQKNNESVDAYTNTFIKLATRVNLTDARQKKRMYLMELNSAYTALVYAQNPADFIRTVEAAKRVETGFNIASGSMFKPSKPEIATSTSNPITQTLIENTPVLQSEVEALTKKLEQLSVGYANIASVLLTQNSNEQRRSRTMRISRSVKEWTFTCYNCDKKGHYSRECSHSQRGQLKRTRFDTKNVNVNMLDYKEDEKYYSSDYFEEDEVYYNNYYKEAYPATRSKKRYTMGRATYQ